MESNERLVLPPVAESKKVTSKVVELALEQSLSSWQALSKKPLSNTHSKRPASPLGNLAGPVGRLIGCCVLCMGKPVGSVLKN